MITFSASLIKRAIDENSIYPRQLLTRGMSELMPAEVLHHTKRGVQAGDLFYRTQQHLDELQDLFQHIIANPHAASLLDIQKCSKTIASIAHNDNASDYRYQWLFLYRAIAAASFLANRNS
jgi:hypothetical protein